MQIAAVIIIAMCLFIVFLTTKSRKGEVVMNHTTGSSDGNKDLEATEVDVQVGVSNDFRKNKGLLVGLSVLGIFLAWFLVSPYVALHGLAEALKARDKERLDEYVDFVVLRNDLKGQMNAKIVQGAATELKDNPFAGFATALASQLSDNIIDGMVTPGGILALIGQNPNYEYGDKDEVFRDAKYSYFSLNKFEVRVADAAGKEVKMYLYRNGLFWKLSKIDINE